MKLQVNPIKIRLVLLALLVLAFGLAALAQLQTQLLLASSSAPLPVKASVPPNQKTFATPQLAAEALIDAAGKYDVTTLLQILGPDAKDIVASADPVRDKHAAEDFAARARERNSITVNKNQATLVVGNNDWPMPIPIVLRGGKWFFDTKTGQKQILLRRIGENELDAIQICRGFVEAQKEYASTVHDDSGIHQYAQKVISTPGKQDGLFWTNPDGSAAGPISKPIALALQEGYSTDQPTPYHGYVFKVLKGQGPAAPLGKLDFLVKGAMIGGFAMVATPAQYRVTGVKTFIVSHDGVVYQKDLGPDSLNIAKAMELYNPDKTWKVTNDEQ